MKCDFSFKHYEEILKKAEALNFKISNFSNASGKIKKEIILRHDVDYSPQRALKMAEIEKSLGIYSTYFIRVHGEYYHPFDRKNYPIFTKIIKLGHEFGLHSEARVFSELSGIKISDILNIEKNLLEKIFQIKIISVAEHGDLGKPKDFWKKDIFKIINKDKLKIKYTPRDFQDFKYMSDSLWQWKEGCLFENLERFDKIQALIHSDLWGENSKKEIKKLVQNNLLVKKKYKNL